MNRRGFSLIELIIVITIISILAAVAIPVYVGQQKKAMRSEAYSNLEALRLLEEQFFAEHGVYSPAGGGAINYNATPGVADNGIEDVHPGFRPGGLVGFPCLGLNYAYSIAQNMQITNVNPLATAAILTPCFVATATGCSARVAGDTFAIDCNNIRNF